MKQTALVLSLIIVVISTVFAGTTVETSKNIAAAPCLSWYADREWNVSVWATYAFTGNEQPTLENYFPQAPGFSTHDTYLEADHAWGGGLDAKYFFARYLGLGVEGYALDVHQSFPDIFINFFDVFSGRNFARTSHDSRVIGSVLGTFTLRYPIGCSRFAPYVFAGAGAIFGGGEVTRLETGPDIVFTSRSGPTTRAVGQFGGGLEVRLTPHIGLISDFAWNVIDGKDNNFGMARTGINFAF